jgi:uncharacterized membrane protein YjjP (DUF1212 family)
MKTRIPLEENEKQNIVRLVRTSADLSETLKLNNAVDYNRIVVAVQDSDVNEASLKSQLDQLEKAGVKYSFEKRKSEGALGYNPQAYFDCRRIA